MQAIIDQSPPYLFALGGVVCFGLAIVFVFKDKIKGATLLGTLFFLCIILAYFPQLDSIAAFSINVKLHNNLERAEEILDKLRELSVINAKSSYMALAWNNRWGMPSAKDKQAILDEVYQELIALRVTAEDRQSLTRQYVQLIGVELYGIFSAVMERYIQWKEYHLRKDTPEQVAVAQRFTKDEGEWQQGTYPGPISQLADYDLKAYLQRAIPVNVLDAESNAKAEKFAEEVLQLYAGCRAKGGYTKEAAEFVDTYGFSGGGLKGNDRKMEEVFGVTMAIDK